MVIGVVGIQKSSEVLSNKLKETLLRAYKKGCIEFVFCDNRGIEQDGLKLAHKLNLPISLITYPIPLPQPLARYTIYAEDSFILSYVDYLICVGLDERTETMLGIIPTYLITEEDAEWHR